MPPSKVIFLVLGLIVTVALIYALVWTQAQ